MPILRRAWLDLRFWWLDVQLNACTDAATRERLVLKMCRLIVEKWGGA